MMEIIKVENPRHNRAGGVDLTVTFAGLGVVEYSTSESDTAEHGIKLWTEASAGNFGPIAPYVEPEKTQQQLRIEASEYLNSTDWYFARLTETGQPVPQDVLDKRAASRALLQ